jgi:flagellin-like hook-associated protein FlgL
MTLYFQNADGSFTAGSVFGLSSSAAGAAAADMNQDGNLDLVMVSSISSGIYFGNGDGTFAFRTSEAGFGTPASNVQLRLADLNGDGVLDRVANANGSGVIVSIAQADGSLGAVTTYGTSAFVRDLQLGDMNGDGAVDIVSSTFNGVEVRLNNGDGSFRSAVTYSMGSTSRGITLADFNGDLILDVASADTGPDTVSVRLGAGDGTFGARSTNSVTTDPHRVAAGDFNGDGIQDIASIASGDGAVLIGNADPTGRRNTLQRYLDLTSVAGARAALDATELELSDISRERGQIGAVQSRLATVTQTKRVTAENYDGARSRIMDADIAEESANLARNEILKQTCTQALAQANLQPSLALRPPT